MTRLGWQNAAINIGGISACLACVLSVGAAIGDNFGTMLVVWTCIGVTAVGGATLFAALASLERDIRRRQ